MARWLQDSVQGMLNGELKDTSIPVTDAEFSKTGDYRSFWTEKASGRCGMPSRGRMAAAGGAP